MAVGRCGGRDLRAAQPRRDRQHPAAHLRSFDPAADQEPLMALIRKDRVLETSTTTGTGALTVAGAVDTFRTFASVCTTNDTAYCFVKGAPGTGEWEVGLYTYSGTNTLTRTTVLDS